VKAPALSVFVLLLIYAAFVSLGLPDGILGAAWLQMRAEFGVALNDNWPMLTLATSGGLLSSFLSGLGLRYLGVGKVLLLTTFLTAFVIVGYALSPSLAVVTGLAFFLGLGNGSIDTGLNHFVASNLSSRHMNWLHAFWGVGVSLGTLIVSWVIAVEGTWRSAYFVVGALQLSLALAFLARFRSLPKTHAAEGSEGEGSAAPAFLSTFTLPASWASMAAFFVYCGLETSTGLWIASVLHDGRGWSIEAAGLMVTIFWSSLTVGRFLIGVVSARTTPIRIVQAAMVGVICGALLIAASSAIAGRSTLGGVMTACGLLLSGLCFSPIFPMLMHDTPRCVGKGHSLNLIGFQAGSAALGNAIIPIAVGTVLRVYSTEWLGGLLLGLALILLALLGLRERVGVRLA
jgi:fucose permease